MTGAREWLAGMHGSKENDMEILGYTQEEWNYIWSTMLIDGAWSVPSITDEFGNSIKDNHAPEMFIKYIAHDVQCHLIVFDLTLNTVQFCSANHLKDDNAMFGAPILLYNTGSHFQSVFPLNHEYFIDYAKDFEDNQLSSNAGSSSDQKAQEKCLLLTNDDLSLNLSNPHRSKLRNTTHKDSPLIFPNSVSLDQYCQYADNDNQTIVTKKQDKSKMKVLPELKSHANLHSENRVPMNENELPNQSNNCRSKSNNKEKEINACSLREECEESYINSILKKKVCNRSIEEKRALSRFRANSYRKRKTSDLKEQEANKSQNGKLHCEDSETLIQINKYELPINPRICRSQNDNEEKQINACSIREECEESYIESILKKKACDRSIEEKRAHSRFRKRNERKRKSLELEEQKANKSKDRILHGKDFSMKHNCETVGQFSTIEHKCRSETCSEICLMDDIISKKVSQRTDKEKRILKNFRQKLYRRKEKKTLEETEKQKKMDKEKKRRRRESSEVREKVLLFYPVDTYCTMFTKSL